jgi:hypothetical protein
VPTRLDLWLVVPQIELQLVKLFNLKIVRPLIRWVFVWTETGAFVFGVVFEEFEGDAVAEVFSCGAGVAGEGEEEQFGGAGGGGGVGGEEGVRGVSGVFVFSAEWGFWAQGI